MDDRAGWRSATALWNGQWPAVALALASFAAGFAAARHGAAPLWREPEPTPAAQISATGAPSAQGSQHSFSAPNPGAGSENPQQALRDTLAGDDPFASAARVTAWLETADAETFRRLAEKPEKFPFPVFKDFDSEFRSAWYASIAERWLEVDPEHALSNMQRVEAALEAKKANPELLNAFAKLRPETALETLPLKTKSGYLAPHAHAAIEALAARDHNAARRFLERITDASVRKAAEAAFSAGLSRKDPVAAATIAAASGNEDAYRQALMAADRMDTAMVRQVLKAGGPLGAPMITSELILRHPELAAETAGIDVPAWDGYLGSYALAAAELLSPAERERLLAGYGSLPRGLRDSVAAAVASCWARTEPKKAAEWAVAHGKADDGANLANTAAQQVFLRWINNDADAALAWWRELPASALRDAIGTNASSYLAENGRIDEALEAFRPHVDATAAPASSSTLSSTDLFISVTDGNMEESAATQMAQFLAGRDPAAAGAWYATLPDSVATERTASALVQRWYDRNPETLARWIESLPSGGPRDQAARVFVQRAAQQSPSGAAEWVETVADPNLRQKAALWVLWQWQADDPAGAREWITSLAGVDPEWRSSVLRRWK